MTDEPRFGLGRATLSFGADRPEDYADWARGMYDSIVPGGTWAVPRSGLVFIKSTDDEERMTLSHVMPHDKGLGLDEHELRSLQADDLDGIRRCFAAAGILVHGAV